MNTQEAIELKNLTKEFHLPHLKKQKLKDVFINIFKKTKQEKIVAIDHLTLKINKGEFLGIIGPNGAGKSTLLKMICNIYQPTFGEVLVKGSISPFLELRVGFQDDLTARENVYLYGALLGLSRDELDVKYNEIIDFGEMNRFMDQKYKYFSSGMQMRLGFAITSHLDKDILLVDEALAVGDETFQKKCLIKMKNMHINGKTIIFVSHNLDLISEVCKKALWLEKGKIRMVGNTKKVVKAYSNSLSK